MRDIINERDEIIGQADKYQVQEQRLLCRVAFIMIVNSKGELMLQQRKATKKAYPLYWSGAAAGHVNSGETYEEAATRELEEELGIHAPLEHLGKFLSEVDREMVAVFLAFHDGPYRLEELEIETVDLFSFDRLEAELCNMKVTSFLEVALPMVKNHLRDAS